jgi:hypothetical protein
MGDDMFFPNADVKSAASLDVVLVFQWKYGDVSEEYAVNFFDI